jgi:hypothetical protein
MNLVVSDAAGCIVEIRSRVAANSTLHLGQTYRSGLFTVNVQQGLAYVALKLIKLANQTKAYRRFLIEIGSTISILKVDFNKLKLRVVES